MRAVHERLCGDDQHDGPALAALWWVLHRGGKGPRLRVDGSAALRRLGLDIAPYGRLLAPAVVVAVVVPILFTDARQGCTCCCAGGCPSRGRLLADRVEQLLRAGRSADDALSARQNVLLVLSHHALRHGIAGAGRAEGRLALFPAAVLAIAQVVVGRDIFVVFTCGPDPSCQAGRRNNNSQGQRHPVAECVPAAGRVLAAVVAVVVEAHGSCVFISSSGWVSGMVELGSLLTASVVVPAGGWEAATHVHMPRWSARVML